MAALRPVVVATFEPGLAWLSRRQSPQSSGSAPGAFHWPAIRDAAQNAAARRGLPLGELRAVVHVLHVEGLWSYLPAPGVAVCSAGTAASPDAATRLLAEAFGSPAP
jgi:hypothetical protein